MAASWSPKQYNDGPEIYPAVADRQPGLEVAQPMYGAFVPPLQNQHWSGESGGFRRATWILSIILALVIIGAAVGGGVGGSICANNAKNSNCVATTVTATPTTLGASTGAAQSSSTSTGAASPTTGSFVPPTNVVLLLDCPSINNTRWPITLGTSTWTFIPYCGADYRDSGSTDIIAVITYSFHDCLQACASRNHNTGTNSCAGVVFNPNFQSSVSTNYGTCFLKPSMETPILSGGNAYSAASLA